MVRGAGARREGMVARVLLLVIGILVAVAAICDRSSGAGSDAVARGKYLVGALGCNDCHTPKRMSAQGPEPDVARLLSGQPATPALPPPPALPRGPWIAVTNADLTAWSGPWGISYAANLTPDKETGIGNWTEEAFVKSIRTGRHMGIGRPILPPMPWQDFATLSDDDLAAIYAYLQSIPPIRNQVPAPVLAPPPSRGT